MTTSETEFYLKPNEVIKAVPISPGNLRRMASKGFCEFETNEPDGIVKLVKVEVPSLKINARGNRNYSDKTIEALLEIIKPDLEKWPITRAFVDKYHQSYQRINLAYTEGRLIGRKSIVARKLHINPKSTKEFILAIKYGTKETTRILNLSDSHKIYELNKMASRPFMIKGPVREHYVLPHVRGRLRMILESNVETLRQRMKHLYDDPFVLKLYLQGKETDLMKPQEGDIYYNPIQKPTAKDCPVGKTIFHEGCGRGIITSHEYEDHKKVMTVYFPILQVDKTKTLALRNEI